MVQNYLAGLQSNPNSVQTSAPKTPSHFDLIPDMLRLHPEEGDEIFCINTFHHTDKGRKILYTPGQVVDPEDLNIITDRLTELKLKGHPEKWLKENVTRVKGYGFHFRVMYLLGSLNRGQNVRAVLQNESVLKEAIALTVTPEMLTRYIALTKWFVNKDEFAQHTTWQIEELRQGKTLLAQNV